MAKHTENDVRRGQEAKKQEREERHREATQSAKPNWKARCQACGQKPTVGDFGLCGPCMFGEADTVGGNW